MAAARRLSSNRAALLAGAALSCLACEPASPLGSGSVPVPVLFVPGVISTDAREYGITFSADGREAYFTRRPRRRGRPEIVVSRHENGAWTAPEPLPFAPDTGEEPFLDPSGRRLFFSAPAPVVSWFAGGAESIWVASRRGEAWTVPVPLPGAVNELHSSPAWAASDDDEGWDPSDVERTGPVLLDAHTLLYSATLDPEWRSDLYVAYEEAGRFVDVTPLSPRINTQGDESHPAVSPDGRLLVFQGDREGGIGDDDLYISERFEHGFAKPRLLPEPINSEDDDGYPAFSPDGRYFFFSSDRDGRNGDWSIYYVDAEALLRSAGPPAES